MFGMKQPPVWHWDLCQVRPETSETSHLTPLTEGCSKSAGHDETDCNCRRLGSSCDGNNRYHCNYDSAAEEAASRRICGAVDLQTCRPVDLQICRPVDLQTCKPLTELLECSAAENIKEKFETFLAEGLLDPLLPNILIQADNDSELKVEE